MITKNAIMVITAAVILALTGPLYAGDSGSRTLDMTYPYDENTIYWPNATTFNLAKGNWGINEKGYWYAANNYSAAEHGGTHVDAPIHFSRNGRTIDQIPRRLDRTDCED